MDIPRRIKHAILDLKLKLAITKTQSREDQYPNSSCSLIKIDAIFIKPFLSDATRLKKVAN